MDRRWAPLFTTVSLIWSIDVTLRGAAIAAPLIN